MEGPASISTPTESRPPENAADFKVPGTDLGVKNEKALDLQCTRCGKVFTQKGNLLRHMRRKYPCRPVGPSTETDAGEKQYYSKSEIECSGCGRTFSRPYTLDRHIEKGRCPALRTTAIQSHATNNITNNTQNNTNITNNTQINVTVNAPAWPAQHSFGQENLSYITPAWLKSIMASIPLHLPAKAAGSEVIGRVMNAIWADGKDHPENLTVVLTTPRGDPLVFENGIWRSAPMDRVLRLMQSQAVDLATNAPRARTTDKDIQSAIAEGEGDDEFFRTARATLKNAQGATRVHRGRLPELGEEGPVLSQPAALEGTEHFAESVDDRFTDETRQAIAKQYSR